MENTWSNEVDSILSVGRSLDSVGVRNWALSRDAALTALEKLSAKRVAVIGGDVYVASGFNVESNYDNWYCNRRGDEADSAFVERSIADARNYIVNYKADSVEVLFAIVPSVILK